MILMTENIDYTLYEHYYVSAGVLHIGESVWRICIVMISNKIRIRIEIQEYDKGPAAVFY